MANSDLILLDRAVLKLTGSDVRSFLQGLITTDMERLNDPGDAVFSALLTPQGKVLFDFFLVQIDDGFLIDVASEMSADLLKRLTFYKLRADVNIERQDTRVAANLSAAAHDGLEYDDPRHDGLGARVIIDLPGEPEQHAYATRRIELAIPEGGEDYMYSQAFAHDAMLDLLGAIDFKKGCYVGQEVVSRMHHRGTARKRIVPWSSDQDIKADLDVKAGEATLGKITTSAGTTGLAMIRLDRLAEAVGAGTVVHVDNTQLSFSAPPWTDLEVASDMEAHSGSGAL